MCPGLGIPAYTPAKTQQHTYIVSMLQEQCTYYTRVTVHSTVTRSQPPVTLLPRYLRPDITANVITARDKIAQTLPP